MVNPALVLGPVLGHDFSDSVQVVERLIAGRMPGLPRLGFNIVDVRDVADLHIRAMTAPPAAGQRFIAAGDYAWMADLAAILRARLGAQAAKVPTRKAPDFLLRLVALFDQRPQGGDGQPRPQAHLHLGQGASRARLEAAPDGRDGARLRPQPDRGGGGLGPREREGRVRGSSRGDSGRSRGPAGATGRLSGAFR